jgi:hypothetical protein
MAEEAKKDRKQPMPSITLEEAQSRLPQPLAQLHPAEEITLTDNGQPVAQRNKAERTSWPCRAGSQPKAGF